MGTTADYLIRYTAFGNNLIFSDTIAEKSLRAAEWRFLTTEADDMVPYLENLYKIAKRYLDGRNATDHKAIYSAVALAVMDHFYRSGYLPRLFYEPIRRSKKIRIQRAPGRSLIEKTTRCLFDEYFELLGGELLAADLSEIVQTFVAASTYPNGELFKARLAVSNQALQNAVLVGGADFDCVIKHKQRFVLTEIKSLLKPLAVDHLRQLIGYTLLFDPKLDDFSFSNVGVYHSRSGSFRIVRVDDLIRTVLPSFKSVQHARATFTAEMIG